MLYEKPKKLSAANLKRYCGVEYQTFEKMCELVREKSISRFKKPKGGELTDDQKQFNKELASERVVIEHIIRHLKIFRIVAEKYRNRRRFILCVNLIAGLYNYALNH